MKRTQILVIWQYLWLYHFIIRLLSKNVILSISSQFKIICDIRLSHICVWIFVHIIVFSHNWIRWGCLLSEEKNTSNWSRANDSMKNYHKHVLPQRAPATNARSHFDHDAILSYKIWIQRSLFIKVSKYMTCLENADANLQ